MPRPLTPLAEASTIGKVRFSEDASSSLMRSSASAALPTPSVTFAALPGGWPRRATEASRAVHGSHEELSARSMR
jgi:hypothetical protein